MAVRERGGAVFPESSPGMLAEAIARKRASPGIIVFTQSLELLYVNREALRFNQRLAGVDSSRGGQALIAPPVKQFCDEILELAKQKPDPKIWEGLQLRRVLPLAPSPLLMRGMAISSSGMLLILMETLCQEHRREILRPTENVLTVRERAVVACLGSGLTNRQIAEQLGLSEHTVKDHLKHVMHKTGTHTRTQLIVRLGFAGSGHNDHASAHMLNSEERLP